MDLRTRWLGLELAHPLVLGASPLTQTLDATREAEAGGAAAIVLHSCFEEQIRREAEASWEALDRHSHTSAEAMSYFPDESLFSTGPTAYLRHLEKVKAAVRVPVVASLNGATLSGWVHYARQLEAAGADALELNLYFVATDPEESPNEVEDRVVAIASSVVADVRIPVSVKLSPFHSSLPHLLRRLERGGVRGAVLFNRFYQPDIEIETLETVPRLTLSDPRDLLLRLRWLALLYGRTGLGLAATGGVHRVEDVVKAIMAGADVVQLTSSLLRHGPSHLGTLRDGVERWFREHEYDSLGQARGSMSLLRTPDPAAYERANYARILQGWRPE